MLARLRAPAVNPQLILRQLPARAIDCDTETEAGVRAIIDDVRLRGEAAVREYAQRFDGLDAKAALSITERLAGAQERIDPKLAGALGRAAERIENFHRDQHQRGYEQGTLALRTAPLARVGIYVPGGQAAYPSSVLMTAIPARVAGVPEIIMVTPRASAAVLAAASLAGVDQAFEVGGAHAVAALAYGTESIPRVDKIVGPGNRFVAAAKRLVYGQVDIDSIAGPSEVLIIADATADPELIAADLLAQAEHDADARTLLITPSTELADSVDDELARQLQTLSRRDIASASIESFGVAIECQDLAAAVDIANEYAPEHLEILTAEPNALAEKLVTAGALFVGPYSPEAAGDYSAGPNHVLPTGGAARYASPLGAYDFVKRTSIIAQSADELAAQAGDIALIARSEGLDAHARSVERRFEGGRAPASSAKRPIVQNILARLLRPELRGRAGYSAPTSEDAICLNANEFPFALEESVARALGDELARCELHRYPDSSAHPLRRWFATELDVAPETLLFGNGSDEIISLLTTTFAHGPQASVCFPTPTFSVFTSAAAAAGMLHVPVDTDDSFELDPASLGTTLHRERPNLVFLARPNNPTGSLWDQQVILEATQDHPGSLFVVDEAYIAYGGESLVPRTRDLPNLAIMRTLSKVGLAALRIGVLHAHPELLAAVNAARAPYNIGTLNLRAATWILENQREAIENGVATVVAERGRIDAVLRSLPGVLRVYESSANFLLFRTDNGPATWDSLRAQGVLIRCFGAEGKLANCLRVTIGRPEENDAFLAALAKVLG